MKRDLSAAAIERRLEELRALSELTEHLHAVRFPPGARRASLGLRIRPVTVADLPIVRGVLVQTWHATYDGLLGRDEVTAITDAWHAIDKLGRELQRPDLTTLLAEASGVVVGVGTIHREGDVAHLDRLYVLPTWQGRGVGSKLMSELIAGVVPNARIELRVLARNVAAIAFYERRGFVRVREDGGDLIMQKRG